ncbi:TPA: short chain dehydrogenase [Aeromonas veronii]|jgi:NAD(P)-dependent dehydrogenase (short-subunit alcohol dehydrogenase family)|uniref:short chain dehydrogenase n=1 Tax=Aeromonas TaxID=642 RepID=UPI0005C1AE21|nr:MULTISPECIES: short chain dehydrogenase [Aeromonas]HEH9441143.1 short chain dehydrogenase [Aeromonas sobria]EKP0303250.1 short chain dehydrogenase [Aeromonas veronii]MCF5842708.1 short chain dehydrogenase [Aeromonas veronii]MCX0432945.1 short chain dehydrogenase [Aeromonas veronii]MDR5015338.1 short chain dehydrogenase [Aeromonas veronii]
MKTVILIGAQGKMGQAALSGLGKHKVITASRSGEGCDFQVDITSRESIERLYQNVGSFDAVVNTAGYCEYAPFGEMSDEQWQTTIQSKLMGQINLVNVGLNYINQGGSFTLISGILNIKPIPLAIADATTSGAIDTFVQCVAHELPRGIRINVVNPTVLEEAWDVYGEMMPGFQPVPGALVGKAFERSVDGFISGQVLYVDA